MIYICQRNYPSDYLKSMYNYENILYDYENNFQDIKEKVMLKEIGKTDSFDRMISALKHSVDQHLNQEPFKIILGLGQVGLGFALGKLSF